VLKRVIGDDYRIQLAGMRNMLKKYWIREHSEEISAMIIETENAVDDMNLFTDLHTETYKEVRLSRS